MRRVFLGIDCGTQSTKVVLRDPASGEVIAVGRAPHELVERDDGTREQDPAWWIDALRAAVRDALHGERFEIGGIGVSGQQHGLVCLDRDDRPVRPHRHRVGRDLRGHQRDGDDHRLAEVAEPTREQLLWLLPEDFPQDMDHSSDNLA